MSQDLEVRNILHQEVTTTIPLQEATTVIQHQEVPVVLMEEAVIQEAEDLAAAEEDKFHYLSPNKFWT